MSDILFAWGNNQHFQCLINNNEIISKEIGYSNRVIFDKNIRIIQCGSSHCIILTCDGEVYGWGNNNFNQLGLDINKSDKPVKIIVNHDCPKNDWNDKYNDSVKITKISCGGLFSLFITYCNCILLQGSIFGDLNNLDIPFNYGSITKVSCGHSHVVLLLSNGLVACFGRNMYGQVGIASDNQKSDIIYTPTIVTSHFIHKVINVSTGSYHTLCIDEINQIFCWGYGKPCGVPNGHLMQPSHLPGLQEPLLTFVGGQSHSLFLTKSKKVYSIGSNEFGQCFPLVKQSFFYSVMKIKYFHKKVIKNIYCGDNYSIAEMENKTILMWGKNDNVINHDLVTSHCFHDVQSFSLHDFVDEDHQISSLSCGLRFIVCHLSEKNINERNHIYSTQHFQTCSSDEESLHKSQQSIESNNSVEYKIDSSRCSFSKRERTFTTFKELYSTDSEIKACELQKDISKLKIRRNDTKDKSNIAENMSILNQSVLPPLQSDEKEIENCHQIKGPDDHTNIVDINEYQAKESLQIASSNFKKSKPLSVNSKIKKCSAEKCYMELSVPSRAKTLMNVYSKHCQKNNKANLTQVYEPPQITLSFDQKNPLQDSWKIRSKTILVRTKPFQMKRNQMRNDVN